MNIAITCSVCKKVLVTVEKPVWTSDDTVTYNGNTICDIDQSASLNITDITDPNNPIVIQ